MRTSKREQILNYAAEKGYSADYIKYLGYHLDISHNGIISDYPLKLSSIANTLFPQDPHKTYQVYKDFVQDKVMLLEKGKNLRILLWDADYLYASSFAQKEAKKRNYRNDPIRDQLSMSDFLEKKYGKYIHAAQQTGNLDGCKVSISYALEGVKIPDTLRILLTGEPMGEKDILLYKNLDHLHEVQCKRNLNKEDKRLLIALCAVGNTDGMIVDFKMSDFIYKVQEIFDNGTIKESTVRYCFNKLKRMGIVKEFIHSQTEQNCVEIVGYKDGFGKGKRYVVVPYAVFRRAFKKLQAAGIKLFFDWIFKLNNGESQENKTNTGNDKVVYFKAARTQWDTKAEREKFANYCRWLRKRCRAEIQEVIMGRKDFIALQEFFTISLNPKSSNHGYIEVRVKEQYFISKRQAARLKATFDPLQRYKSKADYIEMILKEYCRFKYTEDDLRSFTRTLHRAGNKVIHRLLRVLDVIIKDKWERDMAPIRKLGAYMNKLYQVYLHGDRTELYRRTLTYYRDAIASLGDTYEIEYENLNEVTA